MVRQNNLAHVGLIGAGLVMVQPLLTAGSLDVSAKVCVVAFAGPSRGWPRSSW
jgi:hypothetical protein